MTTDITELAQRMKTAAEKLDADQWQTRKGFSGIEVIVKGSLEKGHGCVSFQPVAADMADTKTARAIALFSPANVLALVEALENSESRLHEVAVACATAEQALEKAQQRIAELENNEIQEEGNQFLVVRHPGKVPVIKHPVGELEYYLRQIFKADPLATIDIVTHRYYGVGGQFVKDADEYLHEMSVKVEAE